MGPRWYIVSVYPPTSELRKRRHYEKPSLKRKRKALAAREEGEAARAGLRLRRNPRD
ncbi:MAG: bS21 family ribosomal protein [candidate division NC10 bacterium]